MTSPSQNAAEQQALAAVEEQFQQALDYLNQVQADYEAEKSDLQKAAYDQAHFHSFKHIWIDGTEITITVTNSWAVNGYNSAMKDYSAKSLDIKNNEANLKRLDPQFNALCNTLNSLMEMMEDLKNRGVGSEFLASDLNTISKEVQALFNGMKDKLEADKYLTEMQAAISNNLSNCDIGELVSQMAQYEAAELNDLQGMEKDLQALLPIFQDQYLKAEEDKDKYTIWDRIKSWFSGGNVSGKIAEDNRIMDNASAMMNGLEKVLTLVSAETSNLMPQFATVVNEIQQLISEIKAFIAEARDPSVDPSKKIADFKKILAFVMYLLTQVQLLKQEIENQKAKNVQDMSQGTIQASKNNIDQTEAQQIIKKELEHAAQVMKIAMVALMVTVGAIMMVTSGGIGSAAVIALCTTYEALNTMGTINWNQDLGNAMHSQIGADVVIGVAEGLATFGVGMAADMAIAKVFESTATAAAKTAVQEAETQMTEEADRIATQEAARASALVTVPQDIAKPEVNAAFQKAKEEVFEKTYNEAFEKTYQTLNKIATQAAEKAAIRTSQQFLKQQAGTLINLAVKHQFTREMETAAQVAAKEAVEESIEESATIAKLAARGIETSEKITDQIAERNANSAVAKIANKNPETVADTAKRMAWGQKRLVALILAGMLNNNLMMDIRKKAGGSDDSWMGYLTQVIQMLMQMLLLMGGTGTFATVSMEGILSNLPRMANLLSLIPQGAEIGTAYQQYENDLAQGHAVTAIGELEGESTLLSDFLDMLKQQSTLDRNTMLSEQTRDADTTNSMGGHLHDGELAEINVLISAIG